MEVSAAVLDACRRGDDAAFRTVVEAYQDRVYALCAALAGADGEDLLQETFVRVHAAIGRFDPAGPASLLGWILTIARRLCTDRSRAARVRLAAALPPDGLAADGTPHRDLERSRLRAKIRLAVAALPEDQRAVIALREWDGLAYEEIAAIEGVPVGTVRSRLARAREALRDALGDDEVAHETGR
jgi:RNA polymerase sigma-70 factor (ECF subfamily)